MECVQNLYAWGISSASAQVGTQGFVNFVPALAYLLCLNLPAAFTQPGAPTLADLCTGRCKLLTLPCHHACLPLVTRIIQNTMHNDPRQQREWLSPSSNLEGGRDSHSVRPFVCSGGRWWI